MGKNDIKKTNAARLLDKAGIAYELIPYSVDENNLAADHVAEALGEEEYPGIPVTRREAIEWRSDFVDEDFVEIAAA